MPWEFRLRTWLPAIPVNTAWMLHPAISSASCMALRMVCTVDSMLTTTPFFSPRDRHDPRPMIFDLVLIIYLGNYGNHFGSADIKPDN